MRTRRGTGLGSRPGTAEVGGSPPGPCARARPGYRCAHLVRGRRTGRHRRADPQRRPGARPRRPVRPVRSRWPEPQGPGRVHDRPDRGQVQRRQARPVGDLLAGTCTWASPGPPVSLYRLHPDGAVGEIVGDVGLSNGLDWSDDRESFYFADSASGGVDVFATDPRDRHPGPQAAFRDGRRRARRPDPGRGRLRLGRHLGGRRAASLHPRRRPGHGRRDSRSARSPRPRSAAPISARCTSRPPGRTSPPPTCAISRTPATSSPAHPASPAARPSGSRIDPAGPVSIASCGTSTAVAGHDL